LYMIVQTAGIVGAQALMITADPSGYVLFVIPSILVSIAITPILLSISPTPTFETTKAMSLGKLMESSPLGCVGMFLLGGIFSAQFGMSAVYGAEAGLTVVQISTFVATIFIGAMITQFPIGWISDRMDRRALIGITAIIGGIGAIVGIMADNNFTMILVAGFMMGGTSNPLYSLLLAHTNDFLEHEDMAAGSGGLIFINGLGAISGPLITGWMMGVFGPSGFYVFIVVLFAALALYAGYRATQRATIAVDDMGGYVAMSQYSTTPVAMEIAQEYAIETYLEEENEIPAE
jgi:MFS family permease